MSGESVLRKKVEEAQTEVNPNEVIEVGVIIGLVNAIFEVIKACRNRETAGAHIQRGSAIAEVQMRRALRREGYEGNVRAMAAKLVEKGTKATPDEIRAVLDEASDVPEAPRLWPVLGALAALCLLAGSASAADDGGLWPKVAEDVTVIKDTSLNTQIEVMALATEVESLKQSMARIEAALVPKPAPEPTPIPRTAAIAGVTFQGRAINVPQFIAQHPTNVQATVERGYSIDTHLREHQYGGDFSGLTRAQKDKLHSIAHAMGVAARSASSVTVSRTYTATASNCANGECAQAAAPYGLKRGLFGNWRPRKRPW